MKFYHKPLYVSPPKPIVKKVKVVVIEGERAIDYSKYVSKRNASR